VAWDDNLRGVALEIAASDDRRLRVLAGPGTGKTFALRRYITRVLERGQDPRRILGVTFTRTAARDLRDELRQIGVPGCDEIWVGTLHAFCFRCLQRAAVLQSQDRTPRPLLAVTRQGILGFEYAPLLSDLDNSVVFGDKRRRIRRIGAYEAAYARTQQDVAFAQRDEVDLQFEESLLSWLRFHRAMLIGELIPEALRYLDQNPTADEHNAFDRIIVDEYQDLNKAEQTIIDRLAENAKLAIVGDADQAIYGFKYANPEGIADFLQRHHDTVDKTLSECRRCGQDIVRIANSVITNNHLGDPTHVRMSPLSENPNGEIHVVQWANLDEEVRGLAAYVAYLISNRNYKAKDILVLCPRRRVAYQIRNELRNLGVEAHSFFHEEALEDDEAQEAYALLSVLCNTEDRVALRFWVGFRSGDWRYNQYGKLRTHCEQTGDSPFIALERMSRGELSATGYANVLARFRLLQSRLADLSGVAGTTLLDLLFPPNEQWADPLREILQGSEITDETTCNDILAMLGEYISQPEVPTEPNFVRIMSLHSAKGLTSKATIISTVVDSLIPNVDVGLPPDHQDRTLREQRRLFYVAVTRPREILVLSSPARISAPMGPQIGVRLGPGGRTHPSRFLREIGTAHPSKLGRNWQGSNYS
jgi:DNA helicase-2/ATP-dependent DNA helicase PcrA